MSPAEVRELVLFEPCAVRRLLVWLLLNQVTPETAELDPQSHHRYGNLVEGGVAVHFEQPWLEQTSACRTTASRGQESLRPFSLLVKAALIRSCK